MLKHLANTRNGCYCKNGAKDYDIIVLVTKDFSIIVEVTKDCGVTVIHGQKIMVLGAEAQGVEQS